MAEDENAPRIDIMENGPYLVRGGVPLARKTPVRSEHDEPLTWKTHEPLDTKPSYALCRCGQSGNKPFCDGTHNTAGFDGTETASGTYDERADTLGGTRITVRDDRSICAHIGFCGNRHTNIWEQVPDTGDSLVRLAVINEVEKCPSGALTYRFDRDDRDDGDDGDVEVDRRTMVGVVDDGPLWVTGGITVNRSDDGQLETRPRMTLCRCGQSKNKPLCDGSHYDAGFTDA